jgi:N-acetylmuramoyl-L-alanine amidase/Secretion system C-terminal sorting domain
MKHSIATLNKFWAIRLKMKRFTTKGISLNRFTLKLIIKQPQLMKKALLLPIFLLIFFKIVAQEATRVDKSIISLKTGDSQSLYFDLPVTSIAYHLSDNQLLSKFWIIVDGEEILVRPDAHESSVSELIVFSKPISSLKIRSEGFTGNLTMDKIYVKPLQLPDVLTNKSSRTLADCEKPVVIPASKWRSGLTPPKELPVKSMVKHIIVHHAAGSNTNTNYTDVVRNIYTFHTGTNGWNDVGYNFLIAQDGTIYEGRDGQNVMDGDNVVGAHFCSQNTGTMGICLLGDYMTAKPSDKSIESLAKLIAWKMKKESLEPLAKGLHAASGKTLNNISAHRDGSCSTDCPGDNLYVKLEQIRQKTVQSCDFVKPLAFEDELNILPKIYPNPTNGRVWIELQTPKIGINILDGMGREVVIEKQFDTNKRSISFSTEGLNKGIYFVKVGDKTSKMVVE